MNRVFRLVLCLALAVGSGRVSASSPETFDQAFELFASSCRDPEQNFSKPDRLPELGWKPLERGVLPDIDAKFDQAKKQASEEPGFDWTATSFQLESGATDVLLSITTQTDARDIEISTCSMHFPRIAKIPSLPDLNAFLGRDGEDWSNDPSDMIDSESFRSYNWESPWPEIWSLELSFLPPDHAKIYVFSSEVPQGLILSAEK
jgi:hypothetical protein